LVAKTTDQSGNDTALIFNSSGTQTPSALSGVSHLDYYSGGWWLYSTTGALSVLFGGIEQPAMSSYFQIKGRGTKQSSGAPIIANFETVDPTSVQGSANLFQSRYKTATNASGTSLSILTMANFNIYGSASESNFIGQVFQPIDAVAFIGHSLEGTSYAIGLCFGQQGTILYENPPLTLLLPVYPCDSILQGNYGILDCTPKVRHEIKGQFTLNGGEQWRCPDSNIPAN
jgi:hypothetical protein